MKKPQVANTIIVILILVTFGMTAHYYPELPEKMATHWNASGEVNGYMSKFWGAYILPLFMIMIGLIFMLIPVIDPLRKNIEKFRKYFDAFIVIMMFFMLAVQMQIVFWNLARPISPNFTLPIGIGLLLFYVGILCQHAKRNWFIGIRTPWTLSSDKVWKKTHQIGAKLFKASGIISLLGVFFGRWSMYFILIPVIFTSLYTVIYSYVEYQKEPKK